LLADEQAIDPAPEGLAVVFHECVDQEEVLRVFLVGEPLGADGVLGDVDGGGNDVFRAFVDLWF